MLADSFVFSAKFRFKSEDVIINKNLHFQLHGMHVKQPFFAAKCTERPPHIFSTPQISTLALMLTKQLHKLLIKSIIKLMKH